MKTMKPPIEIDPGLLLWVIGLSGFGGIAHQLWKGGDLSGKRFIGAAILSAITGLLVFLWLHPDFGEIKARLVAVSILAGIGATTIWDVVTITAERYGPEFIRNAINRRNR